MKLMTDKAPALIEGPVFCPDEAEHRSEAMWEGALLVFRCWKPNGRAVNLHLKVNDHVLRKLADLIEQTALTREAQARYLRRQG